MHIPDGFLNHGTSAGMMGAAVTAAVAAFRHARSAFLDRVPVLKRKLATVPATDGGDSVSWETRLSASGERNIQRMAALGSLLFALQMINIPIGGGVSGHVLGGVLAAVVVGPAPALLVMAVILSVQALFFGDGGLLALGANIVNMGLIGAVGGYGVFRFFVAGSRRKSTFFVSFFVASFVSVLMASLAVSLELALSGVAPLSSILPAMILTHIGIGGLEGVLSIAILLLLLRFRYSLYEFERKRGA